MSHPTPACPSAQVAEGDLLWTPPENLVRRAQLTRFTQWLARERGLSFPDYEALWRWSVTDVAGFWSAIWEHYEIVSETPYRHVLRGAGMLETTWFEGARLNYAEHLLRFEARAGASTIALHHMSEIRPAATMTWHALGDAVRRVATQLRALGIQPGDRVVSYMPNVHETTVAMLATTAIGAVWSAAGPEFGPKSVLERFGQIAPKLAFVADGYSFNGKVLDRRAEVAAIVAELPTLETVVWLPYLGLAPQAPAGPRMVPWDALLAGPPVAREAFRFTRVPHDHPLWILYSSGTTGLPKAIVHSHVGMLVDHLKYMHIHLNLGPDRCMFFYTTTGWMMWNFVIAALLAGSAAVLYDGSPVHDGADRLWRIAEATGTTTFGASPTLVQIMQKNGIVPRRSFDLGRLELILLGGSPVSAEVFQWFYTDVKPDLWVTSQSGGTDLCGGLVGAVAGRPVRAGEIQGRILGIDVHAWDDAGQEVIGSVGELVVASPFPSMPLGFWGDPGKERYRDTYFSTFPGVWRHGDLIKINERGGCFVYGRSDATLNRFGVRIGSAEIYRIVEQVPGIRDSLIVCCELPGGDYFMPLFVALEDGRALTPDLVAEIERRLRNDGSPRHVPDVIHQAPAIPYTLTGKKMEVPVRRMIMGIPPEKAASRDSMANPDALAWYAAFAARPEVAARRQARG